MSFTPIHRVVTGQFVLLGGVYDPAIGKALEQQ
jgi:hypothetical protein